MSNVQFNRKEEKDKNISLVQDKNQVKSVQTIPPTQHNNHNHCFIESHDKVLDEQQQANNTIIKRQHERNTIVNQIKKMIIIETVMEDNNKKIITQILNMKMNL